jgi:hypothetical protein
MAFPVAIAPFLESVASAIAPTTCLAGLLVSVQEFYGIE